ncbi:BolA family protein [Mangrovicoccus algicola]|uniref:BolA family transcriptional regulator n=1 Tax=Mangrovicoccus algicola TaxID=2771008 RepID=A0A8J7CIP5_9RHOB|nr:BolA family protein [Mangrovicoccus algicola]MBE3639840.1 BolA family transcriptional regulator [Mangrovicoccus algicola]
MGIAEQIRQRLETTLRPERLEVVNESHMHAGHAGDDGSGESHFRIAIAAAAFGGMTRIARERAIHKAIGPEIMGRIHALSVEIR